MTSSLLLGASFALFLAAPAFALPLASPAVDAPAALAEPVRCKLGSGKCGIDPKNQPGTFQIEDSYTIDDAADWLDDECEYYPGLCGGRVAQPAPSGPTAPAASATRK